MPTLHSLQTINEKTWIPAYYCGNDRLENLMGNRFESTIQKILLLEFSGKELNLA